MPNYPVSKLGYRPELDGLRGVAILLVVLMHATGWPPGGGVGVDIFFTLSGFLITTILLEEWQTRAAISLLHFYARRALRLAPALVTLLCAYLALSLIIPYDDRPLRLEAVAYSIAYLSNWPMAFGHPIAYLGGIAHLWSLGVEEQFYLLWPTALTVCLARSWHWVRVVKLLITLIGVASAWRMYLIVQGATAMRLQYGTDTRIDQFLIGCLVAFAFTYGPRVEVSPRIYKTASIIALVLLATIALSEEWRTSLWRYSLGLPLTSASVICLIQTCLTSAFPALSALLRARWLVLLGLISYSLYVWHTLVIYYVEATLPHLWPPLTSTVALAGSLGAACSSYYLIELPFLRHKKRFSRVAATKTDMEAVAPR